MGGSWAKTRAVRQGAGAGGIDPGPYGQVYEEKYFDLDEVDQEAVRHHAIAALNLTQQAKEIAVGGEEGEKSPNTAFIA